MKIEELLWLAEAVFFASGHVMIIDNRSARLGIGWWGKRSGIWRRGKHSCIRQERSRRGCYGLLGHGNGHRRGACNGHSSRRLSHVEEEIKIRWGWRVGFIGKGKRILVKNDVPGNNDFICRKIKTPVPSVMGGIPQKKTRSGARGEFVRGGGGDIRITSAAENAKVGIGGWMAKQGLVGETKM